MTLRRVIARPVRLLSASALVACATPLAAQPERVADDIVVRGALHRKSDWRSAETDHFILYSNGSEAELVRIARNLEKLHFLLSLLLNRIDVADKPRPLKIYLVGDAVEFDAMDLRNLRSREGPYASEFPASRYYDPRFDGAVAATTRLDQKVVFERGVRLDNLDRALLTGANNGNAPPPTDVGATIVSNQSIGFGGGIGGGDVVANERAVVVPAMARINAAYAQHFLLTYFPAAYPRWYVDGFGQLFSSVDASKPGVIEYGRFPAGYAQTIERHGLYPVAKILDGSYLAEREARTRWTPASAWYLAHYFMFADAKRAEFRRYLGAINSGASLEAAARELGDIDALAAALTSYRRKADYEVVTFPEARIEAPLVLELSRGEAALIKGRLELGARVHLPDPAPAAGDAKAIARAENERARALAARARWLGDVRKLADRGSSNRAAQLLRAEAECRTGHHAECRSAAERAVALAPSDSSAAAWLGVALSGQAASQQGDERGRQARAARAAIVRANRIEAHNPIALCGYYRSFIDSGEPAPPVAVAGLARLVSLVPQAPEPRLWLGEALLQQGDAERARAVLRPVAAGAYETPEGGKARSLIASIPATAP